MSQDGVGNMVTLSLKAKTYKKDVSEEYFNKQELALYIHVIKKDKIWIVIFRK